ncbi:ATP-binding cassette domain-containing protein [Lactobacillus sp. ESL0791]|uniref:ABC transporter ATP-binding protein n=1 Tax=Lactobacillus sp. ESL0791 TaxID=2983234 RepID=UPI0023F875C8|nr:ATP-binding cassette domain-containing protein [Lactobacillus sp. ESL0791]MDF7638934.1 ATP-binding cassette domain-containing protein [Lactobacillus sp. ESL0791]
MLKVQNLNVFIGHKKIIQGINFQIKAGEIVGLIGPNGAGKTTTMKTILGLTKFTGTIKINGVEVTANNHQALTKTGALIEHPAIYPFLTGRQNLILYSKDKVDMNNLIAVLEMSDYIDKKVAGYSLGMKQKLGIAIAFLNKPQLIILDEPMNGLDVTATIRVRQLIKHYAEAGTAFLISSHILSELQKVMTKAILINSGKIIIDQEVAEFNRLRQQKYQLGTENNLSAGKLLADNKIEFVSQDAYLVVKRQDVYSIQDLLLKNHIHLTEMHPATADFEQIVVDILAKQRS